jgi:transcriptional regulator with XRE-family HTH domain
MVDRIQLILKVNNLTASRFADEIGVQRSSISHILSGRNQPSLDLIQKILKRFPDINSEWLLNGIGTMIKNSQPDLFNSEENAVEEKIKPQESIFIQKMTHPENVEEKTEKQFFTDENLSPEAAEKSINQNIPGDIQENLKENALKKVLEIEKIVIFYSNKTFREYFPE